MRELQVKMATTLRTTDSDMRLIDMHRGSELPDWTEPPSNVMLLLEAPQKPYGCMSPFLERCHLHTECQSEHQQISVGGQGGPHRGQSSSLHRHTQKRYTGKMEGPGRPMSPLRTSMS